MKNLLIIVTIFLSITVQAQVVSGGSEIQPKTVQPSDLAGSSFNGDVNLFTGTYSGSYTLGSVATPGGLKFDVNMNYSSSLSGGDNVPVATGIPYGEGWSVAVPTISVSVAEFKSFTDKQLYDASNAHSTGTGTIDPLRTANKFDADGESYWLSPTINIPGVASGRAVFKWLDPVTGDPLFVLHAFEQYIEILYHANTWEVYLPDGTTYFFAGGDVSYRKGYNRRTESYAESFSNKLTDTITMDSLPLAEEQLVVMEKITPKGETLNWRCSQIRNRNLPHQLISFSYESFGEFNFFAEFSADYQQRLNYNLRDRTPGAHYSTAEGPPNLTVYTNTILTSVTSHHNEVIDRIELDYGTFQDFGEDMLNFNLTDVHRKDSMYNYQSVYYAGNNNSYSSYTPTYSGSTNYFNNWHRYLHAKHQDIVAQNPSGTTVSSKNPYIGSCDIGCNGNGSAGFYFRKAVGTNSGVIPFDHSFLESPRIDNSGSTNKIIGGDIYEIKTVISNNASASNLYGFVNMDINIASGAGTAPSGSSASAIMGSGGETVSAYEKQNYYTNETIFSTFGNAVKWNPAATANVGRVITSNLFTMPNLPEDYGGITIQVGPGNSDNLFNLTPDDIVKRTVQGAYNNSMKYDDNAHRSYYQQNMQASGNYRPNENKIQIYDPVPSNFGIGLPWMMMKPLTHKMLGNLTPDENSGMFNFWWNDGSNSQIEYNNKPTLATDQANLSAVELIRYSKNPYMLQAVKTYKYNGLSADTLGMTPGKILVNQFDLEYTRKDVSIIDNQLYGDSSTVDTILDRRTNIYLLKNIKNIPVNGSKDTTNPNTFVSTEVPTTHFEYGKIVEPQTVIGGNLRTNADLYVLNKLITHLGKETTIEYYSFAEKRVLSYQHAPQEPLSFDVAHMSSLAYRNFAVQINVPVKSITVKDDLNALSKRWNYEYNDIVSYGETSFSGKSIGLYGVRGTLFASSRNTQQGFKTTKMIEPEIEAGVRPYSIYHHHGNLFNTGSPVYEEGLLFGKVHKVENFNGNNVKISQNEIFYEANKAFTNGIHRSGWSYRGDWTVRDTVANPSTSTSYVDYWRYDYQDFDESNPFIAEKHQSDINTNMGQNTTLAKASTFLETEFPQYASHSYFIKKVKEVSTEYEATTCNIPDNALTELPQDPVLLPALPGATAPLSLPVTKIASKEGDDGLIDLIDETETGEDMLSTLISASPLSLDVMTSFLTKETRYTPTVYEQVLQAQLTVSDASFANILLIEEAFRDDLLQTVLLNNQYQVSIHSVNALISAATPVQEHIIINTLSQYNAIPAATLEALINREEPRFSDNLIEAVLLEQIAVPSAIHQLLLTKSNYEDEFYQRIFEEGATYPTDNVLLAMMNREEEQRIAEEVVEKVLIASPYAHNAVVMNLAESKYGEESELMQNVELHNSGKPSWSSYCGNPADGNTLSIQNITEYEYWDANERGETTSNGFKKLLNLEEPEDTIRLKYEPSWQLYKTKTYSPELPEAFSEQEYFYYYDLKNKYLRRQEYISDNRYEELDSTLAHALAYNGDDYNEGDVLFSYQGVPAYNSHINLRNFLPAGLEKSHDLNLLNVAYQEITTSKNVSDNDPIVRSTYYNYTDQWNDAGDSNPIETRFFTAPCPPADTLTGDTILNLGCVSVGKWEYLDLTTVPYGWGVYIDFSAHKAYMCPLTTDHTGLGLTIYYANTLTGQLDTSLANGPERDTWAGDLNKTLLLKEVKVQIDTLVNSMYHENLTTVPFPSGSGLMDFMIDTAYHPLYPNDILTTKTIIERNRFTQVWLEENERGLQTRYHYTSPKPIFYMDTTCSANSFSTKESYNIGVPIAVTVGVNRWDSLRTEYEYYPDYSVKRIVDPNGIELSYAYDEFGRLKESYRNGELLSINKYSTWKNDTSLSFTGRALQNSVETMQLKDRVPYPEALQSRKYIDPIGRDYHTMSREVVNIWAHDNAIVETVHTGAIVYDNWDRTTATFKPFVKTASFTPTFTSTNTAYPNLPVLASYENDQKGRVTREAKPGEILDPTNDHNVKYRYSMSNYVCGGCELNLSAIESNLIMGSNPSNVTFKVVEVEDEDGKVSQEYFNALGQKVATKQYIGLEQAITLFIYDSYGNLTKVINPKKQESTYQYNMLGWMYQKQTVDGGITKYMYNESGQVVLEQDQNAKTARTCEPVVSMVVTESGAETFVSEFVDRPYYRQYEYDLFGRLVAQNRINHEHYNPFITQQFPMLYTDMNKNITITTDSIDDQDLFHDGFYYEPGANAQLTPDVVNPTNSFVYRFSNNSTYAWKGVTYVYMLDFFAGPFVAPYKYLPENNYELLLANTASIQPEKKFYYHGGAIPVGTHSSTNTLLAGARTNLKGNLSHTITYNNSYCESDALPIQYDFFGYNNEGNLAWQMHQFNPSGINAGSKGIVTRIDYPEYDLNNNLLVENIDVNNDLKLDMQYKYTYDLRNRIREVYVSLDDAPSTGQLLGSYAYNDATGLVTETSYHKECVAGSSNKIDDIDYYYDVRDRLTEIEGDYFDYELYYDSNMPTAGTGGGVGVISTLDNYNGNINGIRSTYQLTGTDYNSGSNFDESSSYAYHYDGINRLTKADAYWNEEGDITIPLTGTSYGDVNYWFDRIGNLSQLNRNVDNANTLESWSYQYQAGTNKLTKVDGLNAQTTDRNYTYDAAGNLLTDDYRKVNKSICGRANLPFDLKISPGEVNQNTGYLYDASDARIFKGLYELTGNDTAGTQLGLVAAAEYYLKDAAGNTAGILDLNTQEWTWYVFGRERFAKIKPQADQQPDFFEADLGNRNLEITEGSALKDEFIQELDATIEEIDNGAEQLQMKLIMTENDELKWVSEVNLGNFPNHTVNHEMTIHDENQLVYMDNSIMNIGTVIGNNMQTADQSIVIPNGSVTISGNDTIVMDSLGGQNPETIYTNGSPSFTYTTFANQFITQISYYNHDHLGNTRVVYTPLNAECGQGTAEDPIFGSVDLNYAADYYPYGKVLREYNPKAEKYVTTHHERDSETGLDYRGARYYDSDIARFLSLDPAAMEYPTMSDYFYVAGNPTMYTDPDGKRFFFAAGAGHDDDNTGYIDMMLGVFKSSGIQSPVDVNAHGSQLSDGVFSIGINSKEPYDQQYTSAPGPQGQQGTAILNDPNWRITKAAEAIQANLAQNPLKKGEQFNLSGYSTGSVIMAQTALMVANGGETIDNLILIGSTIPEDSDLYKELQNNPNIKNIIRVDIDGDNVQDGAAAVPSFLIKGDKHPHFKYAFGDEAEENTKELAKDLKDGGVE